MAPAAGARPFNRLGLAGLGLIGGSVALAARAKWPDIHIVAVDPSADLAAATAAGAIDESRPSVADLEDRELIVLAMPIHAIVQTIHSLRGIRTTVTDVGSTKREVMKAAAEAGLSSFVGGHPVAGAERGGFAHARADLFDGRPWILTGGTAMAGVAVRVHEFVAGLGGKAYEVSADRHDRTMAYVSHLPQLLAMGLVTTAGEAVGEDGLRLSGRGFADMTRLSASPFDVWRDILDTNGDYIAEAARAASRSPMFDALALADASAMRALFEQGNAWHGRGRQPMS